MNVYRKKLTRNFLTEKQVSQQRADQPLTASCDSENSPATYTEFFFGGEFVCGWDYWGEPVGQAAPGSLGQPVEYTEWGAPCHYQLALQIPPTLLWN